MRHKSLLPLALLLTACAGIQETEPEEFAAPEVTVQPASVSDKSLTVELSGSISGAKSKLVKECGFYISKNADMSGKTSILSNVGGNFSAQFSSEDFGTTFYYQAFIANGKYIIPSEKKSFEFPPFEYFVKVSQPEVISIVSSSASVKATAQWADGIVLDEIGFQYSQYKDFRTFSTVQQTEKSNEVIKILTLTPGTDNYVKTYVKSGDNYMYSDPVVITLKTVTGISLDKTSLTLLEGESETIVATITPSDAYDKTVCWSSSNFNVATVDSNGKVTAVGPGSTTITATPKDGGYKATCKVTVTSRITGISLNKTSMSLSEGESEYLTATVSPMDADQTVTWTTSDANVATVDSDGKVTAVVPGTATITATTKDGGYKAVCKVSVIKNSSFVGRYITFETTSGENKIKYQNFGGNTVSLEYSYDATHWNTWNPDEYLSFSNTSKLYIRGNNPKGFSKSFQEYTRFTFYSFSNRVCCHGSIMNLLSYEKDVALTSECFLQLFLDCACLIEAPELPANTLSDYCYYMMFGGCSSLISAPQLSAMTLADGCYSLMFFRCSSLTSSPELPATALATSCYSGMFEKCTSLISAPQLPATALLGNCYSSMFSGCTSLSSAPQLSATALASCCYYEMFSGCTSLSSAPQLPATTLADGCYYSMFLGCSNLSYVKAMFVYDDLHATGNFLIGVSSHGTFVKNRNAKWSNALLIPDGWTVEYTDE